MLCSFGSLWPLWPVSTTYGLGKYVFIRGTCKAHIVSCHLSNTDEGAPCRVSNTTKKTFAKCQIKSPCSTFRVIYHTISRQTKSHNERKARRQANPDVTLGMRLRFLPIPNAASCWRMIPPISHWNLAKAVQASVIGTLLRHGEFIYSCSNCKQSHSKILSMSM